MRERINSLSVRLFGLLLLIFVPVFGLQAYFWNEWRQAAETEAQAEVIRLATTVASGGVSLMSSSQVLLEALSHSDIVFNASESPEMGGACSTYFARLHMGLPHLAVLGVADADGEVDCSSVPTDQQVSVLDRDYFQQVLSSGLPAVGSLQVDRITGRHTIALAQPLFDSSGEFQGAVIASLDLAQPVSLVADLGLPKGSTVTILDESGIVTMRAPDSAQYVGTPGGGIAELAAGEAAHLVGLDGVARIYGTASIGDAAGSPILVVGVPVAALTASARSTLTLTSILLLVLSISAASVALLLGRRLVIQPIETMVDAARRVAGGDLSVQVRTGGSAEIAALADELNDMTRALQKRATELEAAYERAAEDRRREVVESDRRAHLEEQAQLRDEFFALVSHELRTPLTSIMGYLEVIRDGVTEDESQRFLEVIDRNARRLHRLVGDLLFVASLEAGELRIEAEHMDLASVAAECVEAAGPYANSNQIHLKLESEPVPMHGDPGRLGQAIDNLVSNAVKFTPKEGRVRIEVREENGWATVTVANTGEGISSEDIPHLFERFYRTRAAERGSAPGTGLGLTIVRAIAVAHGGTVEIESVPAEETIVTMLVPTDDDVTVPNVSTAESSR